MNSLNEAAATSHGPASRNRYLGALLVAALYVAAVGLTNAYFMADSGGYVVSILAYEGVEEYTVENPTSADFRAENSFWDFGHLLWRPLGLMLFKIFRPLTSLIVGPHPANNVLVLLMAVNFVAGLASVILLYLLLSSLTGRHWLSVFVVSCFIFSNGFLNFTQTASAYIAALAFLLTGLHLLLKDKGDLTASKAVAGGLACAAAVTMWFPFILVVPATILAPLVMFGSGRAVRSSILYAGAAFSIAIFMAYLIVMVGVGVHSVADFREWMEVASHGVRQSGLARMLFGFGRSFIHLGNDGVLFKRFLLHDPLNPVSALDLVRFSLWKLMLFYLAAAVVILDLVLSSARRTLILLLLAAVPLIGFAIKFDGGAVERYLPLYPVIFIALGWALAKSRLPRFMKVFPVLFGCVAIFVNFSVMARMVRERYKEHMLERIEVVVPRLKPNSLLVTTHLQDDLVNFQASFPFDPINHHNVYQVYPLVVTNSDQAARWQQDFATQVLKVWSKGGDAWLSTRMLSERPKPHWNWVEGDDPRVKWNDVYQFVSQLRTHNVVSSTDGFVLLEKSDSNMQLLNMLIKREQVSIMSVDFATRENRGFT